MSAGHGGQLCQPEGLQAGCAYCWSQAAVRGAPAAHGALAGSRELGVPSSACRTFSESRYSPSGTATNGWAYGACSSSCAWLLRTAWLIAGCALLRTSTEAVLCEELAAASTGESSDKRSWRSDSDSCSCSSPF